MKQPEILWLGYETRIRKMPNLACRRNGIEKRKIISRCQCGSEEKKGKKVVNRHMVGGFFFPKKTKHISATARSY